MKDRELKLLRKGYKQHDEEWHWPESEHDCTNPFYTAFVFFLGGLAMGAALTLIAVALVWGLGGG